MPKSSTQATRLGVAGTPVPYLSDDESSSSSTSSSDSSQSSLSSLSSSSTSSTSSSSSSSSQSSNSSSSSSTSSSSSSSSESSLFPYDGGVVAGNAVYVVVANPDDATVSASGVDSVTATESEYSVSSVEIL